MKRTAATLMWMNAMMRALAVLVIAASAGAQHPIPESERWATITHAGNAPYVLPHPLPQYPDFLLGSVGYEYQIGRTEVTTAEWFEFVQAYAPYVHPLQANSSDFTGYGIAQTGPNTYFMAPGAANKPMEIGWRFAAIYCNWLHNDKALTAEAFERGAYDISTFTENPDGSVNDQREHSPGARYWLPTQDEWIKAAHFDPNKNGPGMPGYWLYPTTSDTAPILGLPDQGGETSAGGYFFNSPRPEVAAYRNVQSPWGLWDASGGASEWLESIEADPDLSFSPWRLAEGSNFNGGGPNYGASTDGIDWWFLYPHSANFGVRLARAVPGPGVMTMVVPLVPFLLQRRRFGHDATFSYRFVAGGTDCDVTCHRPLL